MSIFFDPSARHEVVAANSHFYKSPTELRYVDRTLSHHELMYVVEGSWCILENEQEYQLAPGDVLMLSTGKHQYTRLPCPAGTRIFCIHVSCPPEDLAESDRRLELPELMHMAKEPKIRSCFEQMVRIQWSSETYRQERLSTTFSLLLLELAAAKDRSEGPQSSIADQAIARIMDNPHKRITTQDMADALFVSTKTLNNAMHRKTGTPFYSFERNLKLDMIANHLTIEPDFRLTELADAFGFHDEFHMSNAFKQKFGLSPQKYRQSKA